MYEISNKFETQVTTSDWMIKANVIIVNILRQQQESVEHIGMSKHCYGELRHVTRQHKTNKMEPEEHYKIETKNNSPLQSIK